MTNLNSVVSLQSRSAGDPVHGHLATGLLVDEDLVLVPTPPAEVAPAGEGFDAVVMPVGGDGAESEWIAPRRVAVLRWDSRHEPAGESRPVLAYVQLSQPSAAPRPVFGDFRAADLYGALMRHGNYWRALVEVGAIAEDVPPIAVELLERIPAAPAGRPVAGEPVAWHQRTYGTLDELAARSCPPPLACHVQRIFGDG